MEVDSAIEPRPEAARPAPRITLPEDSPYDLEQVAANYEGRSKIHRLLFIATSSPSVAGFALTLALSTIQSSTLDVSLYETTYHQYRQFLSSLQSGEIGDPLALRWYESVRGKELGVDRVWVDKTRREAQSGIDKLEVELKGYTTNLIKESIRMGHRDLARFLYRTGDLQGAIRSYTKSREYCTTSQHVLEMSVGVIEIALEMGNYSFVRNYVVKAESALEALNAPQAGKAKPAPSNMPGMVAPAIEAGEAAKEKERLAMQERLTVAAGVANLGMGNYERAARAFTGVGKEALSSATGHFVPPADIALYAVCTGLATFDRGEIRHKILENADLRPMIDLEPYLRDVLRAFQSSNFKDGLNLLEKYSARQLLDLHLSPHLSNLLSLIRSRALLSYFTPFTTVSLTRMAGAFGWTEEALTHAVIALIGEGKMKARVDKQAGVLVAKKKDVRGEAFKHALDEGEKLQRKMMAAQLRMRLIKADIVVKSSKTSQENY